MRGIQRVLLDLEPIAWHHRCADVDERSRPVIVRQHVEWRQLGHRLGAEIHEDQSAHDAHRKAPSRAQLAELWVIPQLVRLLQTRTVAVEAPAVVWTADAGTFRGG